MNASVALRERFVKVLQDNFYYREGFVNSERIVLPDTYRSILSNINGFILLCDYTTGAYEYVSDSIQACLGYDLRKLSNIELTNFIFSIIDEPHAQFMLNSLWPVVFKYFKENATIINGTDFRYSVSVRLRNRYNEYHWYLVDTVIIKVDNNGFPLQTLITSTNIDQFKKDDILYYNITKKNGDGMYEVMLEGTADNRKDEYKLTSREIEVINLIGQGLTNKQIAHKLFISLNTVLTHRKTILKKTKCNGTAELTNFAFARGLL